MATDVTARITAISAVRRRIIGKLVADAPDGRHDNVAGGPFEIVETDGNAVPEGARLLKDTVNVGPGERYDVIWTARRPGRWLLHCHIPHHTTNDNVEEEGAGGLTSIIKVSE